METTQKKNSEEKNGFMRWLMEDDSPEIGIASKEPLNEYLAGVKTEFKKIQWPSKDQLKNEFVAVLIIVAIITVIVYGIDLGLDKLVSLIKG
jgi:preprotein translocase subunit SecE